MQDQKYQACTKAMSKVQGDLSRMQSNGTNSSSGASSDAQQRVTILAIVCRAIFRMEQSNHDLSSTLNSDQQAVVASKLKDLDKKTKEMQSLSQQLKSELSNSESDPKIVREHLKKLDKLSKEIAKQQHEIGAALGISA